MIMILFCRFISFTCEEYFTMIPMHAYLLEFWPNFSKSAIPQDIISADEHGESYLQILPSPTNRTRGDRDYLLCVHLSVAL